MQTPEVWPDHSIDQVYFKRGHADDLPSHDYGILFALAQGSFKQTLPLRDLSEVTAMLGGGRRTFENTHRHPAALNEREDVPTQAFGAPQLVVARKGMQTVGYGYAVTAASGSPVMRHLKLLEPTRSHAWTWLREIVVDANAPDGVGLAIGALLLDKFSDRQPVSAYTWEENIAGLRFAASMGLTKDEVSIKPVAVFDDGRGSAKASQARWTAKATVVKAHIAAKPGFTDVLLRARKHIMPLT